MSGTGYFDDIAIALSPNAFTLALVGSTRKASSTKLPTAALASGLRTGIARACYSPWPASYFR